MLFEDFKKNYGKQIPLEDFKNIKKGSSVLYKGGKYTVEDTNGVTLKLKSSTGQVVSVNYSMFNQGGAIS